ncbi:hypothetical protein KAU18_00830, partial [Candidatus Bathyarchaeota archaeon]|nr:hypothetical protein [Candidatus Bathyarchaeota archaeon]
MKKHLITLISPFPKDPDNMQNKSDPGLQIFLNAPEFNIKGLLEKEDFLKYHFGRLEGVIKDEEKF